jgi:XTP/dITP diphosphohydrolase
MKENSHIVYATSNPGKIIEINRHFGFRGLKVKALSDFLPIKLDPDETGVSLGENALIKAHAYAEALSQASDLRGKSFVVISDDTGIFIDGLNGEPGIKVRRWIGRKMTDEEIIDHCLKSLQGFAGSARKARFRTALCTIPVGEDGTIGEPVHVEGSLEGRIVLTADRRRTEGFPFESLFWADEYGLLLGDLHRLPDVEKRSGKFNHRERAIEKVIPLIREMFA